MDFVEIYLFSKIASKKNPKLWKSIVSRIKSGTKGGKAGQWSARKAQLAVAAYKKAGGKYNGKKSKSNSLKKWSDQDWQYSSEKFKGKGRYRPKKVWEKMSESEKNLLNRSKQEGSKKGKQYVPIPEKIRDKANNFNLNESKTIRFIGTPESINFAMYLDPYLLGYIGDISPKIAHNVSSFIHNIPHITNVAHSSPQDIIPAIHHPHILSRANEISPIIEGLFGKFRTSDAVNSLFNNTMESIQNVYKHSKPFISGIENIHDVHNNIYDFFDKFDVDIDESMYKYAKNNIPNAIRSLTNKQKPRNQRLQDAVTSLIPSSVQSESKALMDTGKDILTGAKSKASQLFNNGKNMVKKIKSKVQDGWRKISS